MWKDHEFNCDVLSWVTQNIFKWRCPLWNWICESGIQETKIWIRGVGI